jgi:hypothetical protein
VPNHAINHPGSKKKTALLVATPLLLIALTAGALSAIAVDDHAAASQPRFVSIYRSDTTPTTPAEDDARPVELGVRFAVSRKGAVVGLRFYKSRQNRGPHVGSLWSGSGARLATATFSGESQSGWQTVRFARPISLTPGISYVASYHTPTGYYAAQQWAFAGRSRIGNRVIYATRGVYAYGSGAFPDQMWHDTAYFVDVLFEPGPTGITPAPTASGAPSSSASRPAPSATTPRPAPPTYSAPASTPPGGGGSTTATPPAGASTPPKAGVPAGVTLTPYTGPSTITKDGTVIDAKDIRGALRVNAKDVVITRSRVQDSPSTSFGISVNGSLQISDSTLTGTDNGIYGDNYTATRVEVTGLGSDGFKLGDNTHIDRAWCHDMSPSPEAHADCVQMQNGVVNSSITNSWLDGGRNSAIFLAPDLGPSSNGPIIIDNNVLGGGNYSLYCVDGNNGQYFVRSIAITNNRFFHDARYGPADVNVPVTAANNVWIDTGRPIDNELK